MNSKKFFVIIFLIFSFSIFISCETTYNTDTKNVTQNHSLSTNKKNNLSDIAFAGSNASSYKKQTLVVGLMLPLSGQHYRIGRSLLNSVQLALEERGDKDIIFKIIDTGDEEKLLPELYNVLSDNIDFFVGPVFTNKVNKVSQIIKKEGIPLITLSNNSKLEDNGVYVFGLTLEDEISTLLNFSYNNDLLRYAAIIPENEYGERLKKEIEKFRNGNALLKFKFVQYDPEDPDFYAISKRVSNYEDRKIKLENKIDQLSKINTKEAEQELKKLKKMDTYGELDFDALIIFAQNYDELSKLSSILPYYDVDPKKIQYMGNFIWGKNLSLKEPGLQNGYFTSLNIENKKKFNDKYSKIFNSESHSLASLTYDLIGLISAIHSEEENFELEKLFINNGFIGISGRFVIEYSGKVLREPTIYRIRNQRFIALN